jgi:hypothetical protein
MVSANECARLTEFGEVVQQPRCGECCSKARQGIPARELIDRDSSEYALIKKRHEAGKQLCRHGING